MTKSKRVAEMFKRKKIIIACAVILGFAILLVADIQSQNQNRTIKNPYINTDIAIKTYKGENEWGYDVYVDGALLVHQPSIPSLAGNRGFDSEADAQRVAELVVSKIRQNIIPPTVNAEELKRLGVID